MSLSSRGLGYEYYVAWQPSNKNPRVSYLFEYKQKPGEQLNRKELVLLLIELSAEIQQYKGNLKMNVESWCTVELSSKQDWTRSNRKHNPNAFASTVFKGQATKQEESRLDFNSAAKPEKLAERRHFSQQCKCNNIIKVLC